MILRRVSPVILSLLCLALSACGGGYTSRVITTPQTAGLKPWQKPYEVNGQLYTPVDGHAGFVQQGIASWYGPDFHGKRTSNGEIYNMYAMTAAHKTLPLGTYVRVHNLANGRETVVRINDRGPFVKGRIIDLSYAAAKQLGVVGPGTAPVRIEALGYRQPEGGGQVVYRQPASYNVGTFGVQVGAFTIAANAERLASRMRARYGAASVAEGWVGNRHYYRVRVGRYQSLSAAESAKAQFISSGFSSSFVVALE